MDTVKNTTMWYAGLLLRFNAIYLAINRILAVVDEIREAVDLVHLVNTMIDMGFAMYAENATDGERVLTAAFAYGVLNTPELRLKIVTTSHRFVALLIECANTVEGLNQDYGSPKGTWQFVHEDELVVGREEHQEMLDIVERLSDGNSSEESE
ncbi:uncharacterized protein B0I36DRAFT_355536 [Microdochium trichocladiopsis]|uniref:Uncharacterized protein n=1 Tax=Microdochium trichocladiopsis TaxID=1682393 RepID=A0A9P9BJ56_9PEZI|nr:uncharacterized protein B0I36DRAFT_355536 [Microdochium trichocladiopsis]KAH7014296.1 hypothetical protein B0I36DRAFT_355536 [Microdochium trichocladiopsis]